ncbi:MAG: hypothetical protein O9275_05155 [Microcystis sp. LE19-196.1B]|nr:hypothetical protein [Microcystis sp. LE19-196.1B]
MNITHINLETTSPLILKEEQNELLKYLYEIGIEFSIKHDGIAFGSENNFQLIIGIVIFISEASLSGATWDFLKNLIENIYLKITNQQRDSTIIEAEFYENGNPKRINIATHKNGKITIQNKVGKEIITIKNRN